MSGRDRQVVHREPGEHAADVDVGQTIAASLQSPTLFLIAQDLTKKQVDTNVDQADIGKTAEVHLSPRVPNQDARAPTPPLSGGAPIRPIGGTPRSRVFPAWTLSEHWLPHPI